MSLPKGTGQLMLNMEFSLAQPAPSPVVHPAALTFSLSTLLDAINSFGP